MKKQEQSNTFIKYFISLVTILIVVLAAYRINSSYEKNLEKAAVIAELEEEIEAERRRSLDLEKEYESMNDRDYIEKVARDKFGLIYPDEILIEVKQ